MTTSPLPYSSIASAATIGIAAAAAPSWTMVRSATGARSMPLATAQSPAIAVAALQLPANAPPLAPSASAATEAARAMRTARVMGATLILRVRRVVTEPPECFMPLI